MDPRLEVVEHYRLLGEHRWRIRVVGTKIVVNVAADSEEEALEKAGEILGRVGIADLIKGVGSSRS
ncbi:MAG: hypothetical protein GSR80_000709 [Desulfurococcales archaeon]|nr:hypothetical protein [Desulfurococcales archaeon]